MSLDDFKKEFLGSTKPWSDAPKHRHQRLWEDTVHLDVLVNTFANCDKVQLNLIATYYPDRGKGCASDCLRWLSRLADRYSVHIEGRVEPIGSLGLNKSDLKQWYTRHGFKVDRNSYMLRKPIEREVV